MNMQAMLKQAQKLQKDMLDTQEKINNTEFNGKSSIVTVKMNGKKELTDVKIDLEKIEEDDVELLQDMIMVAINQANEKIDATLDKKMGKFGNIPGLF